MSIDVGIFTTKLVWVFFIHEGNFKSEFVDDILSGLILGGKTEESKSQEINERKPSKTWGPFH